MQKQIWAAIASTSILAVAASGTAQAKPGNTGKSGVIFGGGVPGGKSPGPALPSAPAPVNKPSK